MRRTKDGALTIDDSLLDLLQGFRCEGNVALRHERTLDRAEYQKLDAVLQALGGKWTRASKALPGGGHVFPEGTDAAALLEAALLTGSVKDPKVGDFFETPEPLAVRMVDRAGVKAGQSVLEPSAGHGAIARQARARGANVVCFEQDKDRAAKLFADGFLVRVAGDFLAEPAPAMGYDAVLMNPPFSKEQDVQHVTHALGFVKPGGKLIAVTGPGWRFRQTKRAEAFRGLVDARRATVEELPEGTFRESGTMVRSLLVSFGC